VTILHNVNITIPAHLIEHLDSGIDFGATEQIFNASTSFHNAVQIVKFGGYCWRPGLPAMQQIRDFTSFLQSFFSPF
jgi:hypothetical protein